MARVTVEDCIVKIPNRFELAMTAAQRARDLSAGAKETVERDNDKPPVIALREIAEETIEIDVLQEAMVAGLQKHRPIEDVEEDEPPMTLLTEVLETQSPGDSALEGVESGIEEADGEGSAADADEEVPSKGE